MGEFTSDVLDHIAEDRVATGIGLVRIGPRGFEHSNRRQPGVNPSFNLCSIGVRISIRDDVGRWLIHPFVSHLSNGGGAAA